MTVPASTYSAYVRSVVARYPRGGTWVFAAWYAVVCAAFFWGAKPQPAFGAVAIVAFAAPPVVTTWALWKSGVQEFHADADGLRLGSGPPGAKSRRDLSWSDVQELRITGQKRGVLLEVLLSAGPAPEYRSGLRQLADLAFMFAVPVVGVSRNTPALVVPKPDPARYQIPLIKVSAEELQSALTQLGAHTSIAIAG